MSSFVVLAGKERLRKFLRKVLAHKGAYEVGFNHWGFTP